MTCSIEYCCNTFACLFYFFFFQAEDGIRDHCVTGVQTCALPIWRFGQRPVDEQQLRSFALDRNKRFRSALEDRRASEPRRSEERRVGKECRSRWAPDHEKKKREQTWT